VERPGVAELAALLSISYGKRINESDPAVERIVGAADLIGRDDRRAALLLSGVEAPTAQGSARLPTAMGLLKSGTPASDLASAVNRALLGLPLAPGYTAQLALSDRGVVLGKGSVIVALKEGPTGRLLLRGQEERILALLSLSRQGLAPPETIAKLEGVSRSLAQGEVTLACIKLAQMGQPPLPHEGFAKSLALAIDELDRGMSPFALLKGMGLMPGGMGYPEWRKSIDHSYHPTGADSATVSPSSWDESKHPREDDGRFADGGGSGGAKPTDQAAPQNGKPKNEKLPATKRSMSEDGQKFLEKKEGFRSKVYMDDAGNPTIGYGHKLLPGESFPNGVSEEQAQKLLAADLATTEAAVRSSVKTDVTQSQYDALVAFAYNVGAPKFNSSTLVQRLNAGDTAGAADEFLRWDKVRTKDGFKSDPGLANRRRAERTLFLGE
jgi:GH24 family phage-related lysozyme (muramidase)